MPPIGGIPRAPAPAAKAAPAPASTSTGNNPRGVSIKAPPATVPVALRTGANPRGVAIITPKTITPPAPTRARAAPVPVHGSFGGGPTLAAIQAAKLPASISPIGAMHLLGRFGNEVVHLPETTVEGAIGLGKAEIHDVLHGTLPYPGNPNIGQSQILHMGEGAIKSDPLYQATIGGQGLHALSQNPLGTLLDATAAYGLVGNAAGAVARTGALGDEARAAASMARAPAYIPGMGESSNVETHALENAVAPVARGGSKNLITRMIQRHFDGEGPDTVLAKQYDHQLRKSVAVDHASEAGLRNNEIKAITDAEKKAKPKGTDEQTAARFVIPYGTRGTGDIKAGLQMTRDDMANNPDQYGMTAETAAANIKKLDAAIANPNLDHAEILRSVMADAPVQHALEDRMTALGIKTQEHLDNATRAQYMQQLPGTTVLKREDAVADPRLLGALKDATQTVRDRQSDLEQALRENADKPTVKAARVDLKDAQKDWRAALRDVKSKRLYGTLVHDPAVPAVTKAGSKVFGMHLRPVTDDDYAEALSHEPAGFSPAHVTSRNFFRNQIQDMRSAAADQTPKLAEAGQSALTGEALKAGDVNPGWGAIVRSRMNTANAISVERELQNFMERYADPHEYPTLADAQREAEGVKGDHGINMKTVTWKGSYRNVPKAAMDELEKQFKADHPTKMKILTKPNQWFRNTVLAMSTKLPIMHSVENATRTALMEGDPLRALIRTPFDIKRGFNIRAAQDEEQAARSAAIHTPGGLSHSGSGAIGEDAGKLALDEPNAVKAAAIRFVHAAGAVPRGIITFQRALEKPAQYAALGAHGRQLLQEWGHSWMEVNTWTSKYAEDLAKGIATPEEAQRAAQWMHKVDGQYTAFTGNVRQALRFVPFGSWYVNAARLVMVTLPRDHPLFDELLQGVAKYQSPQWNQQHAGLPADMQDSLKVGPNAFEDIGKFLPIGVQSPTLSGVESTAQSLAVPWISGPAADVIGKGPFMADLYGPNTPFGQSVAAFSGQANLSALESLAEEFGGPANDFARAVLGHGGTEYNTDTPVLHLAGIGSVAEKPGTANQQKGPLVGLLGPEADRVLDPFRPTTYGASSTVNLGAAIGNAPTVVGNGSAVEGNAPVVEGH